MVNKYISAIRDVLNLILLAIAIVERPGDGPDKKKEAMILIRDIANDFLPDWIVKLFLNDATLGILIDYLVGKLNKEGIFTHTTT